MIAGSPLFKNLGLASGMAQDGTGTPPSDPVPGSKVINPNAPDMPLYVPKDTVKLQINDTRKINPATGQPFKQMGAMSASVNPDVVNAIIKQSLDKGIDPNTALAIALQETKMGNMNEDVGSAWSTLPDSGITNPYEQGANSMVKALVDKMAYAKRLGFDKKGEAFALQAYNGYGKLSPKNAATESYYGIPVTKSNPLNMASNPVYGKTIISLRDEVIRKHPEIQALIQKATAARKQKPLAAPSQTLAIR